MPPSGKYRNSSSGPGGLGRAASAWRIANSISVNFSEFAAARALRLSKSSTASLSPTYAFPAPGQGAKVGHQGGQRDAERSSAPGATTGLTGQVQSGASGRASGRAGRRERRSGDGDGPWGCSGHVRTRRRQTDRASNTPAGRFCAVPGGTAGGARQVLRYGTHRRPMAETLRSRGDGALGGRGRDHTAGHGQERKATTRGVQRRREGEAHPDERCYS